MISWSDIEAECAGFRQGLVTVFKKYEGLETDEQDGSGRVVKVTAASFARRMGVAETTFSRWLAKEVGTTPVVTRPGPDQRAIQEAAANAAAFAEAKASANAKVAAAKAEKDKQAALDAQAKQAAQKEREADLKHQQEIEAERKKAKAEAEVASEKKLKHVEELLRAEIKAEPPTPEVLAAMASQAFTSSDPDIVAKMAEAYGQHRVEQDARNASDARARASAARAAQAERDATNATRRASLEYEDSALKLVVDAHGVLKAAGLLMSRKAVTFSNVVASGLTVGEVEDMIEESTEVLKRAEAQTLDATVENVRTT